MAIPALPKRPALGGVGEGINQSVIGALTILIVKVLVAKNPALFGDSIPEVGIVVMGVLNVLSNVIRTLSAKVLGTAVVAIALLALPGCATLAENGINVNAGITGTGGSIGAGVQIGGQGFAVSGQIDLVSAGCFGVGLIPLEALSGIQGWCAARDVARQVGGEF